MILKYKIIYYYLFNRLKDDIQNRLSGAKTKKGR
jgi:hypothetical protein